MKRNITFILRCIFNLCLLCTFRYIFKHNRTIFVLLILFVIVNLTCPIDYIPHITKIYHSYLKNLFIHTCTYTIFYMPAYRHAYIHFCKLTFHGDTDLTDHSCSMYSNVHTCI